VIVWLARLLDTRKYTYRAQVEIYSETLATRYRAMMSNADNSK